MKDLALWQEADWIAAIAVVVLAVFLAVGAKIAVQKEPEFAGHPKGLYMLFFAEMWERFSYYGMRAILIFYLTQHWLFNDSKSNLIYGAYTSLVYITPVLGGYLADRYLGQRKAVVYGGVLLAIGHSLMAVEGVGGQDDPTINVFWAALAFIIVGSGFLKANISVMVGQLYKLTDLRRDPAYTIFYMGINVGAALGTILVAYLGQTIGWGFGFGLAGIGMVAGLVVFVLGKKVLFGAGEAPAVLSRAKEMTLYAVGLASVAVIWALVQYQDVIQVLLASLGRRPARLRALRKLQAAQGTARADVRNPVPDRAQSPVLGPVRAGGRFDEFVHRPLRRSQRGAGRHLPVDQPDLHHPVRTAVRGFVANSRQARARAFGAGQVRHRAGADGLCQSRAGMGRRGLRCRGDDPGHPRCSCIICSRPPPNCASPRSGSPR